MIILDDTRTIPVTRVFESFPYMIDGNKNVFDDVGNSEKKNKKQKEEQKEEHYKKRTKEQNSGSEYASLAQSTNH